MVMFTAAIPVPRRIPWPSDKGAPSVDRAWRSTPRSLYLPHRSILSSKKKWAARFLSGPYSCEGKNLQRGTVVAAALGGKPLSSTTERDMVPNWAVNKDAACMSGMLLVHGSLRSSLKYLYLLYYLIYRLVKTCVSYHASFLTRVLNSREVMDWCLKYRR